MIKSLLNWLGNRQNARVKVNRNPHTRYLFDGSCFPVLHFEFSRRLEQLTPTGLVEGRLNFPHPFHIPEIFDKKTFRGNNINFREDSYSHRNILWNK